MGSKLSARASREARIRLTAAFITLIAPAGAAAQTADVAADRARLAEITGDSTLVRQRTALVIADSASRARVLGGLPVRVELIAPDIRLTWNSAIPNSVNDGAMWAGRGANVAASAGVRTVTRTRFGVLRADLAPQLLYSQNRVFGIISDSTPGRSSYASPFHHPPFSADLPLRFGDRPLRSIAAGSSSITLDAARGNVTAGATTAIEVWGPAIYNPLLLGNNAEGVPRLFVETRSPIRTRAGLVHARLIAGTMTESMFFDYDSRNDHRSLSGVRLQLVPAFDSTLTIGLSRVVYRSLSEGTAFLGTLAHSMDALVLWEPAEVFDADSSQTSDQMTSVFARWIAPAAGFELYTEIARTALPQSATDLFASGHSVGYTAGFQYAPLVGSRARLRLQGEVSNLEQSRDAAGQSPEYYSSQASPQGYTQRGQVLGAAIGPGGSSQRLAADYVRAEWEAGVYGGRLRTETDALYRRPVPNHGRFDVTMFGGVRGAWRSRWTDFNVDLGCAYRYNYLFQNTSFDFGDRRIIDVRNVTLVLSATPRR